MFFAVPEHLFRVDLVLEISLRHTLPCLLQLIDLDDDRTQYRAQSSPLYQIKGDRSTGKFKSTKNKQFNNRGQPNQGDHLPEQSDMPENRYDQITYPAVDPITDAVPPPFARLHPHTQAEHAGDRDHCYDDTEQTAHAQTNVRRSADIRPRQNAENDIGQT